MALTAKQRACRHPFQHIAPCVDARWERCQLCGLIRVAPLPAPWILAHDAAQPIAPPPPLFAEPMPMPVAASVPVVAVPVTVRGPVEVPTPEPAPVETMQPRRMTARMVRERDDGLLGFDYDELPTPPLDEADAQDCPRCGGKGTRREAIRAEESEPGGAVRIVYARRRCPRCGGTGRTCRYIA